MDDTGRNKRVAQCQFVGVSQRLCSDDHHGASGHNFLWWALTVLVGKIGSGQKQVVAKTGAVGQMAVAQGISAFCLVWVIAVFKHKAVDYCVGCQILYDNIIKYFE